MSDTKQQCPTCGSKKGEWRQFAAPSGELCADPWHDSAPSSSQYDPDDDPEQEKCYECGEYHVGGCYKDRPKSAPSSVAPTEYDPDLVDGEGNPVEVGVSPLVSSGDQFNKFVAEWEQKNGSAHQRPYTFAIDYASSVAEQPQPTKKPPYTASDKAVRIVLGTQPKFVVIEPEAHCSLITDDTLLIWAEQPSREQAMEGLVEALRKVIDGLYRAEKLGNACPICRPNYENRHEEGCPVLDAERAIRRMEETR